jgi:hypothetical protein
MSFPSTMTAAEVGAILAAQPANQAMGRTVTWLIDRWIASGTFRLMAIRPEFVGSSKPRPADQSATAGPIIVDRNVNEVGREAYSEGGGHGAVPDVLILDGSHRWYEALDRGDATMDAYVGEEAVPFMEKMWASFASRLGPAIRDFIERDFPGASLAVLRHHLPEREVASLRQGRRLYKESGRVPPFVLHDYPFLTER